MEGRKLQYSWLNDGELKTSANEFERIMNLINAIDPQSSGAPCPLANVRAPSSLLHCIEQRRSYEYTSRLLLRRAWIWVSLDARSSAIVDGLETRQRGIYDILTTHYVGW